MNVKSIKKGFTLTELIIVIVIIGILAGVLIPTFINVVNKANKAADLSLIRNLNEALTIDKLEKGEHKTMTKALEAAEEFGYLVDKINAKSSKNEILWDSKNDVFCYLIDDKTLEYYPNSVSQDKKIVLSNDENDENDERHLLWIIDDVVSDKFSTYYYSSSEDTVPTINVFDVGFDVGKANVEAVNYSGTKGHTVVIRTNGGTLTINAATDTVKHYGNADKVDVQAVANASYHENGTVQLIAVKQGHVKLEGEAEVNGIYVYNNSQGETKDTSFAEIKITVDSGVEVPKLSRSAVEIADEGTKVCTIVTDQSKDVYLFNEGIYEQIMTVDEGKPINDPSATWADDESKNTDNTQTAAQQLANEWTGRDENGNIENQTVTVAETEYTVVFNDETRKFETYTGYENENNKGTQIVVDTTASQEEQDAAQAILDAATTKVEQTAKESGKTVEEAAVASALKGSGTEADPFLVYDYATMQKISDFYDKGYYYFAVAIEKTDNGKIDCTGWVPVKLHGSFDGKGVKFTNVTAVLFQKVGYNLQNENIVLKNFDATMNVSSNGQYGAAALIKNIFNAGVTTFDNVNVHGYLEGFWNMGSFYNYGTANFDNVGCDYEVVFNNCYSDATLVCASGNTIGGLFGHAYEGSGHSFTLRVNNTEYEGQMFLTTTSGKGNKYFGMTSDYSNSLNHFYFDGVEDTFDNGNSKNAGAYTNSTKITKVEATKQSNDYVIAKQNNVSKIVVTITAQLTAYDTNDVKIENLSGITMTLASNEIVDFDGNVVKVLDLFNSVNIAKNASKFDASINNNVLNISLESSSNYKSGNIRLQVNQYDSTGSIVSAGTIDIATCADASSEWIIK